VIWIFKLGSRLRKYGYKTMLCNTTGESTNEEVYLEMLRCIPDFSCMHFYYVSNITEIKVRGAILKV
jgi:hypothetical protein